jgi:scyllo-inositol 2-dehydrogenase (NADP+)
MARARIPLLILLAGQEHDYSNLARPLVQALERTHHFAVDVTTDSSALDARSAAVVLAASDRPLDPARAAALNEFVLGGGGLILLHATLATWSEDDAIAQLAGWAPGGHSRSTELVVRTAPHRLTDRLAPEIRLEDEVFLSEAPPAEAGILLRASWQFTEQVVAYERAAGDGRFVFIGLGHGPDAYAAPDLQKLVHRAALLAAGVSPAPPVGVGLLGYGAIARAHAAAISATAGLSVRSVCDLSKERRALASGELDVPVHATLDAMLGDPDLGLVVVGTPPSHHADPVVAALRAGKHVVCEKPFAITTGEVDRMIDAAGAAQRVLTVYQSRRWDPDYIALRETIRSGRIGDLFYLESFIGGFSHPCDYWHSHEPISGGMIYDWGSHYFDWVLQLFEGAVTGVSAVAHKRVWHDVTNSDQVRVDLTFAGGKQATFMQSDIAAALKPKWYALGTRGAIVGEWRLQEGLAPADSPARIVVSRPAAAGTHQETLALQNRDDTGFYRNLADHIAWGEPLAVLPEQSRRTVAVMETATRSIAQGGSQIEANI